mgnify:CR=1 FL=1
MLIKLKNKDTLIVDDFTFKCCIGKNGSKNNKIEGDNFTPRGKYKIEPLYFRGDRVPRPITSIKSKIIKKNMGWCNDPIDKNYNQEINTTKKVKHEKLFRKDYKYNYCIIIQYNTKKIKPYKGSAIFLHLTKDYKPTAGCIALIEKDFLILLKIKNKNSKININ